LYRCFFISEDSITGVEFIHDSRTVIIPESDGRLDHDNINDDYELVLVQLKDKSISFKDERITDVRLLFTARNHDDFDLCSAVVLFESGKLCISNRPTKILSLDRPVVAIGTLDSVKIFVLLDTNEMRVYTVMNDGRLMLMSPDLVY
jgi:hypothetical protein